MDDLIEKLKEKNLRGRSGSMFPVYKKWEAVKKEKDGEKYIVCNASEGEIDTKKDGYILENYLDLVLEGVRTAKEFFGARESFIYLKEDFKGDILPLIEKNNTDITVVLKRGNYVGGEETALIKVIEKGSAEPQEKPPFPCERGLFGKPTLVHNVETFYCIGKISKGEYERERFYSVQGDVKNPGVFIYNEKETIEDVLKKSGNTPDFDYFLQVGGGACGEIVLPSEINAPVERLGSIIVYNKDKTDPYELMKKWVDFLLMGNCDRCTPCREGLYRISEMIEGKKFDEVEDMFFVMKETSLCPLGRVATTPFKSMLEKIVFKNNS